MSGNSETEPSRPNTANSGGANASVDNLIPADTTRSLPISLLRAREAVMVQFRPMLASHGFTEQQWRVLRVLVEFNHIDASTLASRACILAPSLTRILRTLESKGLLQRKMSNRDGRQLVIEPTKAAYDVVASISPESRAIYQRIESRFGKEKLEELLDLLNELVG